MSTLNNLYRFDEKKYNKPDFNTSSNYYEKKVKEGIPIFQEINNGLYNSKIKYQNYVDPFALLENGKTNNIIGSPSSNLNMMDIETRKIIEQEMKPYISQMKNELNIIVEHFRKEIEEKSNIINEISSLKEKENQNRQNYDNDFINLNNKIISINDKLNSQERKIDKYQNMVNQMEKNMNENLEKIQNVLDNNKNNYMNALNQKIFNDINDMIDKRIFYKFDSLEKNIGSMKEENASIKNELSNNKMLLNLLNSENNNKNMQLNEINGNYNDLMNKINNININNNKILNIFDNFEIKYNELQQKIKSFNDKLSSVNNGLNSNIMDSKTNKENIKELNQKISDMINSIDLIRNERQIFNSKIIEMNVKVESQSEKINKNYNILNEAINQNNNNLYKDLTTQISKNKDLLENLKDDYDTEISKVRAEINQFDLIIKNNPFLNLNENERLSILFKKEQLKVNETFKNSFYTIEKNFKTIDKKFEAKAKGLEQNMIKLTEIIKDLSDKKAKKKK